MIIAEMRLSVEKLKPGMRLAEDIYRGSAIFCKKGTVLTEAIIEKLKEIGIEEVSIEEEISKEKMRKFLEEKISLVEEVFKDVDNPCARMIKKAFVEFWKKLLSDGT